MNRLSTALCRSLLGLAAATATCGAALAAEGAAVATSTATSVATPSVTGPVRRVLTARLRVTETVLFTGLPPCFAYSTVQGTGTSNVLGNLRVNATDCVNPEGGFTPGGLNHLSFASLPGTLVFTTANGERIHASYSGTVDPWGRLRGHFVVTGGTGTYFGATGGGTLSGQMDLSQIVTAQGLIDAAGEITY
ncbi:hypothetical protein [Aquabacterium humicola]|uniref:hypothetical protein n=1 Tax=Aquabacterium humicola TaxID=3237377 RepID=UPI002543F923|nr:hypothetical protein [Rubrivivax pictus]